MKDSPLFHKILELSAENSEFLTKRVDERTLKQGVGYYRGNQIADVLWLKEKTELEVHIWGAELHRVKLNLPQDQDFQMSCNCGPESTPLVLCKHIICALLSLREILAEPYEGGGKFWLKPQLRQYLASKLFKESAPVPASPGAVSTDGEENAEKGLEIHLLGHCFSGFTGTFYWAGKPLPPHSNYIPQMLRTQAVGQGFHQCQIQESYFIDFLRKTRDPYSVFIHTKDKKINAVWEPEKSVTVSWRMNLQGREVQFQRLAKENKKKIARFMRLGKSLCFFPEEGILGKIKESYEWPFIDLLEKESLGLDQDSQGQSSYTSGIMTREFEAGERIFSASYGRLTEALPFVSKLQKEEIEEEIQIEESAKKAAFSSAEMDYEVHFYHTEDPAVLRLEWRTSALEGAFTGILNPRLFEPFLDIQEKIWFGQVSKDAILRVLFQCLLDWDGGSQSVLRKDFEKRVTQSAATVHLRYEAKTCLEFLLKYFEKGLKREQLVPTESGWKWINYDMLRLFQIFGIAYLIFGKRLLKQLQNPEQPFLIKAKDVYSQLPALHSLFALRNTKLFVERKQTGLMPIHMNLRVHDSGEDWFELHPEVKIGERLLTWAEWQKLLAESQSGAIETESMIQILDSNATALSEKLASILKMGDFEDPALSASQSVKIPRLQILDWIALQKSGIGLTLPKSASDLVEKLLNFESIEERKIPKGLKGKLRDYQVKGYEWLAFHYEHQFGACLADDMGLGKTLQAIAFLAGLKEGCVPSRKHSGEKPHLIVVPPTLLFNWQLEIQKFYSDFKVTIYAGSQREWEPQGQEIVLTSYDLIRRDLEKFSKIPFHVIIFDEAQMVKNLNAQRTKAVRKLQGDFKMCLTGTPFENHLGEYFSVLDLCAPGLLGEYSVFKVNLAQEAIREVLIHRTKPFVLRRSKEKILSELPPKTESDIYLDLSEKQKALYSKIVQEVRPQVERAFAQKPGGQARMIFLTALLRLRQICVAPQLMAPSFAERPPKIEYLLSKLEELREEGHASIVFSQFAKCLLLVEKELKQEKISYLHMDGNTPMKKRQEIVEHFQKQDGPLVFLISLKTGGVGLNLTRASYVFHLDPWWNPAVDRQASDRVHRIGQNKPVFIQRILMRHSVEEKVMSLRKSKQDLFQQIMDDGLQSAAGVTLTRQDIEYLLA